MTTKILKRLSDDVVLFAKDDLVLDDDGLHSDGWTASMHTPENSVIEEVDLPENFIPGMFQYVDDEFIVIDQEAYEIALRESIQVPDRITSLQAQLVLIDDEKWDLIQPEIDRIPDPIVRAKAQAHLDKALTWTRRDPFVLMLAPSICLNEYETDLLFIKGSKIS